MPGIETDRLELRQFTLDDLEELSTIFADPEVVRHLGSGKPASKAETEKALQSIIAHWERHGFGRWAAIYKPTRELIGYGGLRNFQGEHELVYLLSKPYWGLGLATELAQACLKFGFDERAFKRIIAMAKTSNVASHRVLEKIGMRFETTDIIYDMEVVCYALSRSAYQVAQSSACGIHYFNQDDYRREHLQA